MSKKPRPRSAKRAPAKTMRSKPARANSARHAQPSKLDLIVSALRAPRGASVTDLMALTGWQMHSVRGAIAGALKKKRGLSINSTKTGSERVYRIVGRP